MKMVTGHNAPGHYASRSVCLPNSMPLVTIPPITDIMPHDTMRRTWPYVHDVILSLCLLKNKNTRNMAPKSYVLLAKTVTH